MYQWLQIMINGCEPEGWHHSLLLRKPLGSNKKEDVTAFRCCAPAEKSSIHSLARASGKRWAIETCFEEAKGLLGMDEYEVRNWTPWYRHMTAGHAGTYISCIDKNPGGKKTNHSGLIALTVQEVRILLIRTKSWLMRNISKGLSMKWSEFRRRHQLNSMECHKQRQLSEFMQL